MDSAYDAEQIRACSRKLGHVPLIDGNPRRDAQKKAELQREALAQRSIGQLPPQARRYHERSTVSHLPKHDERSAKSWLCGKLFVALLVERLIGHARSIAPRGYELGAETASERLAGLPVHAQPSQAGH